MLVGLLLKWRRVGDNKPSNCGLPCHKRSAQGRLLYGKLEFGNTTLRDDELSRDALC
jgi:hypothetical protein